MKEKNQNGYNFLPFNEQCGYFINKKYINNVLSHLQKPHEVNSFEEFLKSPDGIMEMLAYTASQGFIDLTDGGEKEKNLINWIHIGEGLHIDIPLEFLYENLSIAHETRALYYENLSKERSLTQKYFLFQAETQRKKAEHFKNLLSHLNGKESKVKNQSSL